MAALLVAFTAGMAVYAAFATQLAVPALLGQHGVRLDTLEVQVERIDAIIPIVESDHMQIGANKARIDSMKVTMDGVWCIMRAEAHNLDPLRECFVPRPTPTRNGNGDNGGEQ